MKFIIALSLVSFSFLASAESTDIKSFDSSNSIEAALPGPGKRHKAKRTNKKRKRKCAKFGRRSFAG